MRTRTAEHAGIGERSVGSRSPSTAPRYRGVRVGCGRAARSSRKGSAVDGTVGFYLDPGAYSVRCVRADRRSPDDRHGHGSDTATPSTIDGTSIASTAETPPGLTGSVAYTAPVYDGAIGPLAARDSWTLTRSVTSLPANISSAKFTIQARGRPRRRWSTTRPR